MHCLQRLINRPSFFYVISHERSGTHFLINAIKLNTSVDLNYQSIGEWFGPFDQPQKRFNHIQEKFQSLNSKTHYVLKSHCDRDLFEKQYPQGKTIYIFRDYRDVLTSYYHFVNNGYPDWARQKNPNISQTWFSNFSDFIRQPLPNFMRLNYSLQGNFSNPIERWANHVIKWIKKPKDNIKIITYNQLYSNTEKITQELLSFLGFPSKRDFIRPSLKNSYSIAPRKGIVGDWKNQIASEDLVFLENAIAHHRSSLNDFPWESKV